MASKKTRTKKYSAKASKKVAQAMHERKQGTLRSGRSKKTVTSRQQAIAIGLSEARAAGAKVPSKPSNKKTASKKKASQSKSRTR